MTTDASVYIHIPFCIKKCGYCSFYSIPNCSDIIKREYKEAINAQLRSFSDEYGALRVDTLYIGGGTPPAVGVQNLSSIIRCASHSFYINSDAEITVEINPLSADEDDIKLLASLGVNRFSIGLQSADDVMLKKLGRVHTVSDFYKTYENCRKYCNNVSVDLMYALPDQSMKMLESDVGFVLGLDAEHISLYCLTLEKGTELFNNRNDYHFADDDGQADMYGYICKKLSKSGYCHYEISNFAKKGRESRHNSKCWQRYEYIGFGAAAHSFFKNKRYFFESDVEGYIKNALSKSYRELSGLDGICEISPEEAEKERIMLGLRMKKGIGLDRPVPEMLIKNGYVNVENGVVSLTDKGMFVSNAVINELI